MRTTIQLTKSIKVSKIALCDYNLSYLTLGLLCTLYMILDEEGSESISFPKLVLILNSSPENSRRHIGRDSLRKALKELEEAGYIIKTSRERDEFGRFISSGIWVINLNENAGILKSQNKECSHAPQIPLETNLENKETIEIETISEIPEIFFQDSVLNEESIQIDIMTLMALKALDNPMAFEEKSDDDLFQGFLDGVVIPLQSEFKVPPSPSSNKPRDSLLSKTSLARSAPMF